MKLELTEDEATVLHQILGDEQLRALSNLDKAIGYQFHEEVAKQRKRYRVADRLYKRLTRA